MYDRVHNTQTAMFEKEVLYHLIVSIHTGLNVLSRLTTLEPSYT